MNGRLQRVNGHFLDIFRRLSAAFSFTHRVQNQGKKKEKSSELYLSQNFFLLSFRHLVTLFMVIADTRYQMDLRPVIHSNQISAKYIHKRAEPINKDYTKKCV